MGKSEFSRRNFMKLAGLGLAGLMVPGYSIGQEVIGNSSGLEEVVGKNIVDIHSSLKTLPENYSPELLKKFNRWIDETIDESREKSSNSIIVDKNEYSLYLIKKGKLHSEYNIELGWEPSEDKMIEGDGKTPEGEYHVTSKRDVGQTMFYRAFLINYPNEEDKKKGKTGGLIEIHGNGSGKKGNDQNGDWGNWTFGCMATSNENMDRLFGSINEKDRVTIVRYTDKFY